MVQNKVVQTLRIEEKMRVFLLVTLVWLGCEAADKHSKLQIGVKKRVENCDRRSKKGKIEVITILARRNKYEKFSKSLFNTSILDYFN